MKNLALLFTFVFALLCTCSLAAQQKDTVTIINYDAYEESVYVYDDMEKIEISFRADGLTIDPWKEEVIEVSIAKLQKIFAKGFSVVINEDEYEYRMRPTKLTFYEGDSEGVSIENMVGIFFVDIKDRVKSGDVIKLTAFNIYVSHDINKVQSVTFKIK